MSERSPSAAKERETCKFGCCEWGLNGEVIRYAPHPPDCRYCREDAVGMDAMGRPACEEHIEQVADDLGVAADRLPDPEPKACPQFAPHGPHEWNTGVRRCACPGVPVSAAVSPAEPPEEKRELTEYEKGYLDGVLAYAYRSDGEVYVGKNRLTTYKAAALGFLRKQGIDTEGWDVNAR